MVDRLLLKASLLTEGIRAPGGLPGLGDRFKEQLHGLFGWDFENHPDQLVPDDFLLGDGTTVQFRLRSDAPFTLEDRGDGLTVYRGEEALSPASLIPRPGFYGQQTTDGQSMARVGQVGGRDNLFFCYQNYCSHFSTGQQCAFCNLVSTSKTYGQVLKKKETEQIGEVAGAAFSSGEVRHMSLTGGCFAAEKEVEVVTGILEAVRRHTGLERIPGILLPSPAAGPALGRYYEAGISSIGYSVEIWDDALYRALCPGKAAAHPHDDMVRLLTEAVAVFGRGNVYLMLVMGLETRETFLEGVRAATGLGVRVAPYVWAPNPGSRLSGHRAPFASWYADTVGEAARIVAAGGLAGEAGHCCWQCDGNTLLMDALRKYQ